MIMLKVIFKTLQFFAILLSLVTRAEEASILTTATVAGDINETFCFDPLFLIAGYFKNHCETIASNGEKEFVIDL